MTIIDRAVMEAEGRSRPDPFGMWGHVGLRFSYGIEFRPDAVGASASDGDMDVDTETETETTVGTHESGKLVHRRTVKLGN